MRARLEAVWKKDAMTWSQLTGDEFTVVGPEGRLQTKAERLAALKTEKPQPVHAVQREQIQVYGETVLHRLWTAMNGFSWFGCDRMARGASWRLKSISRSNDRRGDHSDKLLGLAYFAVKK
jgi:hypothetical protein